MVVDKGTVDALMTAGRAGAVAACAEALRVLRRDAGATLVVVSHCPPDEANGAGGAMLDMLEVAMERRASP